MIDLDEPEDQEAGRGLLEPEWTGKSLALSYGTLDGRKRARERSLTDRMRALFDDVDVRDRFTARRQAISKNGMLRGSLQWEEGIQASALGGLRA
ncbi:hypothetical protein LJR099_004482 [Variovorax paradoxus]|uniref:hypothetical protein n=1 Tax=Variovorax paradoxus TaxID=34073 RepID=UPI00399B9AE4